LANARLHLTPSFWGMTTQTEKTFHFPSPVTPSGVKTSFSCSRSAGIKPCLTMLRNVRPVLASMGGLSVRMMPRSFRLRDHRAVWAEDKIEACGSLSAGHAAQYGDHNAFPEIERKGLKGAVESSAPSSHREQTKKDGIITDPSFAKFVESFDNLFRIYKTC
jgi:hypothetical protein